MYAKLRMLDGKLSVFFRLDLGFWEKTWTKKVAGWSGPKKEWKLLGYELKLGDGWDLSCTLMGNDDSVPGSCPTPSWLE